ncbi:hypothetical protein [Altibacter sp.]|uniref:AbiTii domain-containing protein n=1 Tax=Altibacter sp. TaxID=2024823 RepID=UPI000C8DA188|nr:hypothetical protein [Altibacter sp.]MAP53786.1 hypothetical protein [Altibacter sp.]|tara:strand:- start:1703 stop:2575 length:873 start_codon:yes stop_codon:yes gene_type:complete
MIKQLIKDLTYDQIDLTQGLTRAKIIAFEIENESFKKWISTELNGYTNDDKLPGYRILPCDIFAVIVDPFGQKRMIPYDLTNLDKDLNGKLYKMDARQSIPVIEQGLKSNGEQYGYEELPMNLVASLRDNDNDRIIGVRRRIQFSQAKHILNITKQKLIDTLLELDKAFPDLKNDDYRPTKEDKETAKTIINNNIYGDNASSTIGVSDNLTQNINNIYNQKVEQILSDLRQLNVPEEDLSDLKDITINEKDKSKLGKNIMSWVGKMTTKAVEKGIDVQIPIILEKVQDLI